MMAEDSRTSSRCDDNSRTRIADGRTGAQCRINLFAIKFESTNVTKFENDICFSETTLSQMRNDRKYTSPNSNFWREIEGRRHM